MLCFLMYSLILFSRILHVPWRSVSLEDVSLHLSCYFLLSIGYKDVRWHTRLDESYFLITERPICWLAKTASKNSGLEQSPSQ